MLLLGEWPRTLKTFKEKNTMCLGKKELLSTTANTTKAPDPNQASKDVFSKVKKSRTEQAVARLIVRS